MRYSTEFPGLYLERAFFAMIFENQHGHTKISLDISSGGYASDVRSWEIRYVPFSEKRHGRAFRGLF